MLEVITPRQREILTLIEGGFRDWQDMAEELNLSASIVRRDVRKLCRRFECHMGELPERVEAAA